MRDYLIFSIAAPMASFGAQYDPGERRNAANRPSKSGVLGMIAAALGIERDEHAKFEALRDSLGFAVRVEEAGIPAFDYHTSQAPKQAAVQRWTKQHGPIRTRADELSVPKTELKTILSTREFRVNAFASPALWLREAGGPISLAAIAEALKRPHFPLYAGRKAHPLMLPCHPRIVAAEGVREAFALFDAAQEPALKAFRADFLPEARRAGPKSEPVIYCDLEGAEGSSFDRVEQRRDFPESRTKWRFGLRQEAVLSAAERGTA